MTNTLETYPYPLIQRFLREHAGGTTEYALIQFLKTQKISLNGHDKWCLSEPQALFDSHFEVMHALYELRDLWRQEATLELVITPLRIWIAPYYPNISETTMLVPEDRLRAFYLDRSNQTTVTADTVEALIRQFMEQALAANEISKALITLGFSATDTPDWSIIKKRYKAQLADVHPDKGGNHEQATVLNNAYQTLRNFYLRN